MDGRKLIAWLGEHEPLAISMPNRDGKTRSDARILSLSRIDPIRHSHTHKYFPHAHRYSHTMYYTVVPHLGKEGVGRIGRTSSVVHVFGSDG